jgi:ABC-2 type transport system ATP-binding protein
VRQGALADVLADGAPIVRIGTPDAELAGDTLRELELTNIDVDARGGKVSARLGETRVEAVAHALVSAGVRLRELGVERPDLEDLFVSITGEGFDVRG